MRQTFHILNLINQHEHIPMPGVEDLTPGIGSLHVRLHAGIFLVTLPDSLQSLVRGFWESPLAYPRDMLTSLRWSTLSKDSPLVLHVKGPCQAPTQAFLQKRKARDVGVGQGKSSADALV